MSHPNTLPNVSTEIINVTKNSKGFKFHFKPIENLEGIESYRVYLSDYTYNIEPNGNPNSLLIKEIPYSVKDQYIYYIPRTTGVQYLTIFCKNAEGLESTGVLFSGEIPYQNIIKEVGLSNLNYYTEQIFINNYFFSGGMINIGANKEVTTSAPYAYLGWQIDRDPQTTEDVRINSPDLDEYDLTNYFKEASITFYTRIIPANDSTSGILLDNTLLRTYTNDIYNTQSAALYPNQTSRTNDLNITKLNLTSTGDILTISEKQPEIISIDNRYFLFDYGANYEAHIDKNVTYTKGVSNNNELIYNSEIQNTGEFFQQLLNLTGADGEIPTSYIPFAKPGHYSSYFAVIEAIDSAGNSSAGGNIYETGIDRYTNEDGYKLVKINHNKIAQSDILNLFKNYYRQNNNELVFEFRDKLPIDIGLDSVIILPYKYNNNINQNNQVNYYDRFIFLRNLKNIQFGFTNPNYKIETINDDVKITCALSSDSLLIKDNIFSARVYYLNSLQAGALNLFLEDVGYTNESVLTYLNDTDLMDKYITLNKFIKDTSNYTSTIAASYQGLVYFFTPESYPYIAWPNETYRDQNLNKEGARMLDFEKDGFASGPQFFDYFPRAQAEIDGIFPSENKYRTTYRCLDSYKYASANNAPGLEPEDVPTNGINGSPSYLGVYDPGNIGDTESPEIVDFKYVKDDLKYFSAKNIYSVKLLSVGIQKDDAYAIVEFILDIPDADDFIIQGISGTDTILEKGIKEINGVNYHYFVAKFVSSCGIDTDPILNGEKVDVKNIVDSKKMISFLVYPTKFKIIEDASDVPYFGDFYLLASDVKLNQFNLTKICSTTILKNNTDCAKGCCVDPNDTITRRTPFKQFYILSQYIANQSGNSYPNGKICDADKAVYGSTHWQYKAVDYTGSNIISYYKKPTNINNSLSLGLAFYPEHNVGLHKVIIYMKQTPDINNITWQGSDIIDSYVFSDIVKYYPIYVSIPDFIYSNRPYQSLEKIIENYNSWVKSGQTFGIKVVVIDNSGDTISQTFIFENNESC